MISKSSTHQVKSVKTGFKLIEILHKHDGATTNELSDRLELAKSTVHNYLNTLESMGYVWNHNGTYRVGLRFLTHGMAAKNSLDIDHVSNEALLDIATEFSQSAWWITEELGQGIFIENAIPEGNKPVYGRIGKRSHLHTHGPGKAILSHLPRDYVTEIIDHHGLPMYTDETVTEPETLFEQLDQIQEQGYAITDSESALGVQSIGVSFEASYGRYHAIGVFGYSHDLGAETLDRDIISFLQSAANDLSHSLSEEARSQ